MEDLEPPPSVPPNAQNERVVSVCVLLAPAADVDGQWVAHCLEIDVVTQGNSLMHALEMAKEAATMVITDDIAAGLEPLARQAPSEAWEPLTELLEEGERGDVHSLGGREQDIAMAAVLLFVHVFDKATGLAKTRAPHRAGWSRTRRAVAHP